MLTEQSISCDAVIFGGSASGLWILQRLIQAGYQAVLLEANRLGQGQTILCQGIIHGGLKYTLDSILSASAQAIRDMPELWQRCLAGQASPVLKPDILRAHCCHLWGNETLKGNLGLIGARFGLRITPKRLPRERWPQALIKVQGGVFQLDEQVVSPRRLLETLAEPVMAYVIQASPDEVSFSTTPEKVDAIMLTPNGNSTNPQKRKLTLRPRVIILTAGTSNAILRQQLALNEQLMQIRSVQMLLARGHLPVLNGHCIEGAATKATITSDRDKKGRTLWQIGGQLSEEAVNMEPAVFIQKGRRVLQNILGGRALNGLEWATYHADKAEVMTPNGCRPNDAFARLEKNIITAWPTKLALVPRLAAQVLTLAQSHWLTSPSPPLDYDFRAAGWFAPNVAQPPWEEISSWTAIS